MPGTDRDRALALGVMMCLQRERHWHFTMSMPRAWFWSTITLGIYPIWTLSKRFARYREHERMVLEHFCDALQSHIARSDAERIRDAIPPPPVAALDLHAVSSYERSMLRFIDAVNQVLPLYELPAIDAGVLQSSEPAPLAAALLPPWNWWSVRFAHAERTYVESRSLYIRTELAQRLAELRWTPLEPGEDGALRVG